MAVIICKSCGTENEVGRVFCNECNEKLDSKDVKEFGNTGKPAALTQNTLKKKIKDAQKKDRPNRAVETASSLVSIFFKFVGVVILLAILGALGYGGYLIYKTPTDIPSWKAYADYGKWEDYEQLDFEQSFDSANIKKLDLEDALLNRIAIRTSWSEKQANAWISRLLPQKPIKFGPINARFIGAYLKFLADGKLNIVLRYRVFDQDLYFQYLMRPSLEGGSLYTKSLGGMINSLPIPPIIMERLQQPISPLMPIFSKNKARLIECESIFIDQEMLVITAKEKVLPDIDPLMSTPPEAQMGTPPVATPAP